MKYLPSVLVTLNGKMARWKESHVAMDRDRKGPTLTFSPYRKTYILLSESLLAFLPEENDLYEKECEE
jgi:hypothetical protein